MVTFKPMTEEDVLARVLDLDEAIQQLTDLKMSLRRTLSSEMKFRLEEILEAKWLSKHHPVPGEKA